MASRAEANRHDSSLPAGYTYFGQFVDHDMTFDQTDGAKEGDDPSTDLVEATADKFLHQKRSPTLDLDSLYGLDEGRNETFFNGSKFIIGETTGFAGAGEGPVDKALRYDLPRRSRPTGDDPVGQALIDDPRNDENLAVAQTHLMWMKFHNHIVDRIRIQMCSATETAVFAQARELTTFHYQHVVLHDFLGRILDKDVFEDIIVKGNRKLLKHMHGEESFMPLEFSVAAYRYGHSQVRETYDWNRNFGTGNGLSPDAGFDQLFRFSQLSGDIGSSFPTLPTNWIADFRRLYDFGKTEFPDLDESVTAPFNRAKMIDAFIAPALGNLPGNESGMRPSNNLAALNLRRGSMLGLPSGQDMSRALTSVKMITKTQMRNLLNDDFDMVMEMNGLYERTPLWLYCLLEAASIGKGERLGPLASTIVADTFLTLVMTSRRSILRPGAHWEPADAQYMMGGGKPLETIPDILTWMDRIEPIVDPLQDRRLL